MMATEEAFADIKRQRRRRQCKEEAKKKKKKGKTCRINVLTIDSYITD